MKLKKKLLALVAAAALTLSLGVPAFAAVEDTGFSDVDADAWYAEAVMYCREHNLMAGIGNGLFAPENSLTRAQLATVLYRIEGTPAVTGTDAFTDTPDGAWYNDAVLWASQQELIGGYGGGLFGPNDPVTREQMTTIFWRYAGSPATEGNSGFSDNAAIASYAVSAATWAGVNSIVRPATADVFSPKANATRAQVADALMNYSRLTQEEPAQPEQPTGSKSLVVYFAFAENIGDTSGMTVDAIASASLGSANGNISGNLQLMAQTIQENTGADVHHIVVAESYDPDYNTMRTRAYEEMDNNTHPALQAKVENLDQYDVIYLGSPVWGGRMPPAVASFLSENNLSGKTIIPFGIHMGSGFGSILSRINELAPNANILDGLTVNARTDNAAVRTQVVEWLNGLQLD